MMMMMMINAKTTKKTQGKKIRVCKSKRVKEKRSFVAKIL